MTVILASRPNVYTGSPLDRAAEKREDEAWMAAALADPGSLFAPVWRARNLMRGKAEGKPEAVFLTHEAAAALRMAGGPWAFLGLHDGVPLFTVDVSAADDPVPLLPAEAGEFVDLRAVPGLLSGDDASIMAHARGLMHWRSRHLFCGVCGTACEARSAGHVMFCPGCSTQHFPRTDPAVIMLVYHGDRALLGHSARFPASNMYSTLAGFVEPGESLEEAVAREVFEESGVRVGRVHYHSSQPWPFPASIMLGFYAEALTEAITIDPGELVDARWFTREQMRNHRDHGFLLPRGDSIASRLIADWIEAGVILTIGYQSCTITSVIAELKSAGATDLLDIRAVPQSRKPGFSKRLLGAAVEEAGMRYLHLRGLGTPKAGRDAVRHGDVAAMHRIFNAHMASDEAQADLANATSLVPGRRACLLCFERDHTECHRTIVAGLLTARTGLPVRHLMAEAV